MTQESDLTNARRFLNAYARIEKKMGQIARETRYVPFGQLLSRCARENRIILNRQEDLREYNELRNAIVHQRGKHNEIIAEPSDSVTEDIERIADLLEADESILQYASCPVRCVSAESDIRDVFHLMEELETTKIPVYDDGVYQGIVTVEEIARWGIETDRSQHLVKSILTRRKNERVLFLKRESSVESAIHGFESALNHGTALLAILITEHGSLNEPPLGIITVADLPKILKALS